MKRLHLYLLCSSPIVIFLLWILGVISNLQAVACIVISAWLAGGRARSEAFAANKRLQDYLDEVGDE
jgi:hypothetical protein